MKVYYPPEDISEKKYKSVFLAGTIDMGNSEDWQNSVISNCSRSDICFFNPRRKEWDSSWEQKIDSQPFTEQVEWELNALETADLILMYFAPGSQAPVSLLETGLFARSGKLAVCCPEGFWRKGNIDIVCRKYRIKQVNRLEDFSLLISSL